MKSLQEEREAIVEELYNKNPYRYRPIGNRKDDGLDNVRTALLSHEEKVVARVEEKLNTLETFEHHIPHEGLGVVMDDKILTVVRLRDVKAILTLPITDEK